MPFLRSIQPSSSSFLFYSSFSRIFMKENFWRKVTETVFFFFFFLFLGTKQSWIFLNFLYSFFVFVFFFFFCFSYLILKLKYLYSMQDRKAKNSWTNKSFASEISAWTCINAILYIPSALPLSAFCLHGVTSLSLSLSLSLFIIILGPVWILRKTEQKEGKKIQEFWDFESIHIHCLWYGKKKKKKLKLKAGLITFEFLLAEKIYEKKKKNPSNLRKI